MSTDNDNTTSFQDQVKHYFDTTGFKTIMGIVDGLEGEAKLKWLKELLPYGASKFNSSEYRGKHARDITITLELDKGNADNED
jgi:hypothetical protein